MMIIITCPNNNVPERSYAVEVLLSDVLGIKREDYCIIFQDDVQDYSICVDERRIIIEDHFFSLFPEPSSYLKIESVPKELGIFHGLGLDLPIIYGVDKFEQCGEDYTIGLDVFASTFFMLTRWEESLLGREEVGDCDETQLFAVKYGFYNRPVINEYAGLLRKLLPSDYRLATRDYEVVLSHDVDGFMTPSWKRIVKDCIRQTIYGAPKNTVLNLTWREEIKYKKAFPTVYDQFKFYTELAEKYSVPEWFYFKVCSRGEKESTYLFDDRRTIEIVEWLKTRNSQKCVLGFHPSQSVFRNDRQWNKEVSRIVGLLNEQPSIGRNHHLLYNFEMLRLWEHISDSPLNLSNCVFHKRQGFRSGICTPYRLFDIFQRRIMNIVEHPCQIMDTVIRYDEKEKAPSERWSDILSVVDWVREYRGELVLTWHIYIRNQALITEYYHWCERVMQYATN